MRVSVTEFRKNFREILDKADEGEMITLVRYDREYRIHAMAAPNPGVTKGKRAVKPLDMEDKKPEPINPNNRATKNHCPHGYAKGMCKKADCNKKYAA